MINPYADVNWHPDRAGLRTFGWSLVIGFPIVAVLWLVGGWIFSNVWYVRTSLGIGLFGAGAGLLFAAAPPLARPFYLVWYGLACAVGMIVANTLLLIVFYAVFTPIGVIKRNAGQRAIDRQKDPSRPTYWDEAKRDHDPSRYLSQF
jgi:hypothetical protein